MYLLSWRHKTITTLFFKQNITLKQELENRITCIPALLTFILPKSPSFPHIYKNRPFFTICKNKIQMYITYDCCEFIVGTGFRRVVNIKIELGVTLSSCVHFRYVKVTVWRGEPFCESGIRTWSVCTEIQFVRRVAPIGFIYNRIGLKRKYFYW